MINSLYRCALCGSKNVVKETKKEGFSIGKSLVGGAIFGGSGLIAGALGKKNTYYHCSACGHTLTYCMSESVKDIIDSLVDRNDQDSIKSYKKEFSNIESEVKNITESFENKNQPEMPRPLIDKTHISVTEQSKPVERYYLIKNIIIEHDCIEKSIINSLSSTKHGKTFRFLNFTLSHPSNLEETLNKLEKDGIIEKKLDLEKYILLKKPEKKYASKSNIDELIERKIGEGIKETPFLYQRHVTSIIESENLKDVIIEELSKENRRLSYEDLFNWIKEYRDERRDKLGIKAMYFIDDILEEMENDEVIGRIVSY